MRDLDFISGRFFDCEIPKGKRYLLKYFKTDLKLAFLRYYFVFGNTKNFTDHTGLYCKRRLLFRMEARLKAIVEAYDQAKSSLTEEGMATVQRIETGKFRLTRKPKS